MSNTAYCYHCGRPHPKEEMRQITYRSGNRRWRCIKSIMATRKSVAERDAFGKRVTETNSSQQSRLVKAQKQAAHPG